MGTSYDIYKTYFKNNKYSTETTINDETEKLIKMHDEKGYYKV
jgi:hypothetical protein